MEIRIDDLQGPDIRCLLAKHLHSMTLHSPPESIHALDVTDLQAEDPYSVSMTRRL